MKQYFPLFIILFSVCVCANRVDGGSESIRPFGIGAGYTTGFVEHKTLKKSYNQKEGYYFQVGVFGNYIALTYRRCIFNLKKDILDQYQISDLEAILKRFTFEVNEPIFIMGNEIIAMAPTINWGIGGYRFVLSDDAFEKLGKKNLTRMHNKDVKIGQLVGIGFNLFLFQRVHLNVAWNVNWVIKDYHWWYIIVSSLVPLFLDETDNFTCVHLGLNIMFGPILE